MPRTRGIEPLEVRIDDGGREEAEVRTADTIDTWRQWFTDGMRVRARTRWRSVRRTAKARRRRPIAPAPFPDGATGHHTILVEVT
jgi:hypothetical protein